jgi:hypothetical protein
MWKAHLRGEQTSLNPLSMITALIGAMRHAEVKTQTGDLPWVSSLLLLERVLSDVPPSLPSLSVMDLKFLAVKRGAAPSGLKAHADALESAVFAQMTSPGQGTRDLSGPGASKKQKKRAKAKT